MGVSGAAVTDDAAVMLRGVACDRSDSGRAVLSALVSGVAGAGVAAGAVGDRPCDELGAAGDPVVETGRASWPTATPAPKTRTVHSASTVAAPTVRRHSTRAAVVWVEGGASGGAVGILGDAAGGVGVSGATGSAAAGGVAGAGGAMGMAGIAGGGGATAGGAASSGGSDRTSRSSKDMRSRSSGETRTSSGLRGSLRS